MLLIIGITGASGAIYGIRLLEVLSRINKVETHLVITAAGESNIKLETDWEVERVKSLASVSHNIDDIGASIASGSFKSDGMVIAPCSMKTLAAIANSYSDNLLTRSADVTLKEKRKLVVLARETPFHLGHLRNMVKLAEMDAIIFPPVPAFYFKPRTIQDLVDHTIGKILDIFNIEHTLFTRWEGIEGNNKISF